MSARPKISSREIVLFSLCVLVITTSGFWAARQQWREVPVGNFKITFTDAQFQHLSKVQRLSPRQVKFAQEHARGRRLVPVHFNTYLSHDGPRPNWWGKDSRFELWTYTFVDASGTYFESFGGTRVRYDSKGQRYSVEGEYLLPDDRITVAGAKQIVRGKITMPTRLISTDPANPTKLVEYFSLTFPVTFSNAKPPK